MVTRGYSGGGINWEIGIDRYTLLHRCCSVAKSCLTLRAQYCSTPGSSVLHCLLEFAQNHVLELVILSIYQTKWITKALLYGTRNSVLCGRWERGLGGNGYIFLYG